MIEPPDQNSIRLFLQAAQAHPERTAFVEKGSRILFGELLQQVKQTAFYFQAKGITSGDAVLVFVPVSIGLYRAVLALFYLGAVPVFLDGWAGLKRTKACCAVAAPKAIIAPRSMLWLARLVKPFRGIPVKATAALPGKTAPVLKTPQQKQGSDAALITFTTGTTATPKAAIRTHGILNAQFNALAPLLQPGAPVSLTLLPVVVLLNIGLGRTTLLSPVSPKGYKRGDARKLVRLIGAENVSSVVASPFIVTQLARYCRKQHIETPINEIITGGGPVFPDEASFVMQAFPGAAVTVVYGSTEAEPISHISAGALEQAKRTVEELGLPVGTVDKAATVAILPFTNEALEPMSLPTWQRLQQPAGIIGEIVVSGSHVVARYLSNPEAERLQKIYVNAVVWHRTGDAGRLDKTGNLFLYGPAGEVIQHQGKTIYPFLVAYGARQVTGILDAALFKHGDAPVLAISVQRHFRQADLKAWLEQHHLTGIKICKLPAIPKDARHRTKIDYKRLRALCRS